MTIRYTHHVTDAMLTELATDIKALYSMKEIVNYVYNGKPLPPKYEKIIERPISGIYSEIKGHISLQKLLTNTLRYCFTTQTNKNTVETKQLRETIMRIKLNINQLKQINPDAPEIAIREKEIELLNKKIEASNNNIENNNSIKNKYVNVAEASYNILLRKDNFPQYFYLEICNKLGVRINEREHFIRDYEGERYSIQDGVLKKEYTSDVAKEVAMIHQRSNQTRQKRYVPPCFRQPETPVEVQQEESKEEESEEEYSDSEDKKQIDNFPTLGNNLTNQKQSIWNNKPKTITESVSVIVPTNELVNNIDFNLNKKENKDDEDDEDDEDDWSKM